MTILIDPRVEARVASVIGAIPGCSVITRGLRDLKMRSNGWGAEVSLKGWSPSLHGIHMKWDVIVGPLTDYESQVGSAVSSITRLVEMQRERAAAALSLPETPSAFPLDKKGHGFPVKHLEVDASALAIQICDHGHQYTRSPPYTPEQAERARNAVLASPVTDRMHGLGQMVSEIHSEAVDHDGGAALRGRDVAVSERRGVRALDWAQVVRTPGGKGPSGQGMLRGQTLTIDPVDIPDTVAAVLIGRPLRDLVDIHPMLSDRTIRKIRKLVDGRVSITLSPAQIAIAAVKDLSVADALDLLHRTARNARATVVTGGDYAAAIAA